MNRLINTFGIILFTFHLQAQNNPFHNYGYQPQIATLSQGEYIEPFDSDTIVQIGSILYNTMSKQIVAFVETDTLYSEATLEPDIVSRWMSPDPLQYEFPEVSPYNFVKNSPILFIDPDGRKLEVAFESENHLETFKTILDNKMGNLASIEVIDGVAKLRVNDNLTVEQKATIEANPTYNFLSIVIEDTKNTAQIYLGDDMIIEGSSWWKHDSNPKKPLQYIDTKDAQQTEDWPVFSGGSITMHEIWENYYSKVTGLGYDISQV